LGCFALSGLVPDVGFVSQGDGDARRTRVALPWADLFGPFGAEASHFPWLRFSHEQAAFPNLIAALSAVR
jgi:hypothetical protein